MGFEQLAIVGVAIGAAIALLAFASTMKITRQLKKRGSVRGRRRLVGTPEGAQATARSVVEELARNHTQEVDQARGAGKPSEELIRAIAQARDYYLSRVETRYKPVFHEVVDEIVFGKKVDGGQVNAGVAVDRGKNPTGPR